MAGLFHLAYFIGLFFLYPHAPLWVMLILGFVYSLMVNANINGIGHNFIHNPFFRSRLVNRLFGVTQSIACCFSQTYYDAVHMQHHKGNSDRQDENGETIDWFSIYRHGHDGEAGESVELCLPEFLSRRSRRRSDANCVSAATAICSGATSSWPHLRPTLFVMFLLQLAIRDLFLVPFFYLGHCFSYLNGYYRHYGANPDKPIAWGVSSYGKIYNWLFFYNGYHAEHHFRPKVHWTRMERFHQSIADLQKQEGVRTIRHAHMFGFLDPDLPKRGQGVTALAAAGAELHK